MGLGRVKTRLVALVENQDGVRGVSRGTHDRSKPPVWELARRAAKKYRPDLESSDNRQLFEAFIRAAWMKGYKAGRNRAKRDRDS